MFKIREIITWYTRFDDNDIVIKTLNHQFEINIDKKGIPHLLGLHYMSNPVLKGRELWRKSNLLNDEEILHLIEQNNPSKLDAVKERIAHLKYFLENIDSAYLYSQTNQRSDLNSKFLLVKCEDGKFLQLGIAQDKKYEDYFETFFVRGDDSYFKNTTINEKIISIEKWEQDKLVPFSFQDNVAIKEKTPKTNQRTGVEYVTFLKNNVLIQDYATEVLGLTITTPSKGRQISFAEHDSVVVYLQDNEYFRYSSRKGGSIIDFIMEFQECDFHKAVKYLGDYAKQKGIIYDNQKPVVQKVKPIQVNTTGTSIQIPEKDEDVKYIYSYLINKRCIKKEIVQKYINRNLLYQDKHKNCVFVGYNKNKEIKYVSVRSSYPKASQNLHKWECKGSNKEVGFYVENNPKSETLVICESCIDIMSVESLGEQYENYNYLSCGGVSKIIDCMKKYIHDYSGQFTNIILGLDNDDAGKQAKENIKELLKNEYPEIYVSEFSFGNMKDANAYICFLQQNQNEELERDS